MNDLINKPVGMTGSHGPSQKIAEALTPSEFQEVRRFWYQVYCQMRGVLRDQADHAARELDDVLLGKGRLLYARGASGQIIGTVMGTYERNCDLGYYSEFYELPRLAAPSNSISIATKLMVAHDKRGTRLALALLKAITTAGLKDGITHCVYDTNPPTDALFRRVGGIDWLGFKNHPSFGNVCVMMTLLRDDAHILSRPGHPLSECYVNAGIAMEEPA
jgi:hypothetical protein